MTQSFAEFGRMMAVFFVRIKEGNMPLDPSVQKPAVLEILFSQVQVETVL